MQTPAAEKLPQDSFYVAVLYFSINSSSLEFDRPSNAQWMDTLNRIMDDRETINMIDSFTIESSSSPDGASQYNINLSSERAAAIKDYITTKYPGLDSEKIKIRTTGENWEGFREMVETDHNVPYRDEVLKIINMNTDSWKKNAKIKNIGGGSAFRYIKSKILPYLRSATCSVTYRKKTAEIVQTEEEKGALPDIEINEDSIAAPSPTAVEAIPETMEYGYKRPVAFKTNLLLDLASALNAEIEIPAGKHFSVTGEILFPWWLWSKKQYCLEILSGTLEGRYWIKPNYNRQDVSLGNHNPLTGWFVGIYGNAGKYDVEWDKKGYQGEVALSLGLSAGYVKPLSRNLSIEFSLGVGYMQTKYRYYEAKQDIEGAWHLIKQYSGIYRWIGPTKAKISLIWYPHFKYGKKTAARK